MQELVKNSRCMVLFILGLVLPSNTLLGQGDDQEVDAPSKAIEIADEPVGIDPATLIDPVLCEPATAAFGDSSLSEVLDWISETTGVPVILNRRSLDLAGILESEPVTDGLNNEPVYLLLDRLDALGLDWRYDNGTVLVESQEEEFIFTQHYNLGQLLDDGFTINSVRDAVECCVGVDSWEVQGGNGGIVVLGDVMFVKQTQLVHRQVAGLLAALKQHGRRTLIVDPPQHQPLRVALDKQISFSFDGLPLTQTVRQLGLLAGARIELDVAELNRQGIRPRQPIELSLEEQPLRLALDLLRQEYDLAWQLRNGVLEITSMDARELKTAVFDVRDLCRDASEARALRDAIVNQAVEADWVDGGGMGDISFPKAGAMVVTQYEAGLDAVLDLLENYRMALRQSKPRENDDADPVITRYYRMPTIVAEELEVSIPQLVEVKQWDETAENNPFGGGDAWAVGSIRRIVSWPESIAGYGDQIQEEFETQRPTFVPFSVLVIKHRKSVQGKIVELLNKIQYGESLDVGQFGGSGGMGGFGGGFFNVSPQSGDSVRP